MTINKYDAGPRTVPKTPQKKTTGIWGAQPPSGFGFRDPVRLGPGPTAIPRFTRPGSKKGDGLGSGFGRMLDTQISKISRIVEHIKNPISNISWILENLANLGNQTIKT